MKTIKISTLIKSILFTLCCSIIVISSFSMKAMYDTRASFKNLGTTMSNIRDLRKMSWFVASARGDINYIYNDPHVTPEDMEKKAIGIENAIIEARKFANAFVSSEDVNAESTRLSKNVFEKFTALMQNYQENANSLKNHQNWGFVNGPRQDALEDAINAYSVNSVDVEKQIHSHFDESLRQFILIATVLLLASIAASLVSLLIIKRSVFDRMKLASSMLEKIGAGELYHDFEIGARNEIGLMLESLYNMKNSLNAMIASVRNSSEQIKMNASEIDGGNHNLAARTEEQASALQQTAASMEEIKTTVSNNAENARKANNLAYQARSTADSGFTVMGEVVSTMEKISQSAKKISEINRVIDGIANQTNILALNAAVEAARAGEQGRGFSVVATEVRNLAKRSADAAKEISHLIGQSVKNVDDGARLIENAGNTMNDIVTSVTHVSDIMQEITQASEEQSTGVSQIATAVNEMDLATQQNASMVEESSHIVRNMNTNAHDLIDVVSQFQLTRAAAPTDTAVKAVVRKRPVIQQKSALPAEIEKSKTQQDDDNWTEF